MYLDTRSLNIAKTDIQGIIQKPRLPARFAGGRKQARGFLSGSPLHRAGNPQMEILYSRCFFNPTPPRGKFGVQSGIDTAPEAAVGTARCKSCWTFTSKRKLETTVVQALNKPLGFGILRLFGRAHFQNKA